MLDRYINLKIILLYETLYVSYYYRVLTKPRTRDREIYCGMCFDPGVTSQRRAAGQAGCAWFSDAAVHPIRCHVKACIYYGIDALHPCFTPSAALPSRPLPPARLHTSGSCDHLTLGDQRMTNQRSALVASAGPAADWRMHALKGKSCNGLVYRLFKLIIFLI